MSNTFSIIRGDTLPVLTLQLLSGTAPLDLTNVSQAVMRYRKKSDTQCSVRTMTIKSPPAGGLLEFLWTADDTAIADVFTFHIKLIYNDGSILTVAEGNTAQYTVADSL